MKGELWAMMLDAKRTFDEIVARLAPDEQAREEILANPVYRELSTAVAGSHELSAIAKLYELYEEHDFDMIVLDTPPSRNALDFLNAPTRLLGFLEGRALQVFLAPGGLTARLFGRGTALVFAIFARVTGVDMLAELSRFFRSLSGVIDGFGERTRGRRGAAALAERTRSLIVTSPEAEPAREAQLPGRAAGRGGHAPWRADRQPRARATACKGAPAQEVARAADAGELGAALAARVASNLADFDVLVRRDAATIARLSRMLPGREPIVVPQLDEDVQDLLGLGEIAEHLFA